MAQKPKFLHVRFPLYKNKSQRKMYKTIYKFRIVIELISYWIIFYGGTYQQGAAINWDTFVAIVIVLGGVLLLRLTVVSEERHIAEIILKESLEDAINQIGIFKEVKTDD